MGGRLCGVDSMTDFLLELRSEEIPARMQKAARADLEKLFARIWARPRVDGRPYRVVHPAPPCADCAGASGPDRSGAAKKAKARPKARRIRRWTGFAAKTALPAINCNCAISKAGNLFCGDRKAGQGGQRCAGRSNPGHYPRLPMAKIHALGRCVDFHRKFALGPAIVGHCCHFGRRSGRMRRHGVASGAVHIWPPFSPSRPDHHWRGG